MDFLFLGGIYTNREKCTSQNGVFNETFTEIYEENTTMR